MPVVCGHKRHVASLPLAKVPRALLSVSEQARSRSCAAVTGYWKHEIGWPLRHTARGWGILAVRSTGKGLDKVRDQPLHTGMGRASRFSQFSLARRPQSPREANFGPPVSPRCEGERQLCSGRGAQAQPPRAHRHRPEIGSLPPLSLRKPGPSPGGEVPGAGAACCPQINALSCLQRICAF